LAAATTSLLNVNALPFTTADLQSVKHGWALPRRSFTTLNIDHRQMGLGGENSWGARPSTPHVLPFDRYEYSFRLRPFHTKTEDPLRLSRQALPVVAPH
jgi:beta-galactosidase